MFEFLRVWEAVCEVEHVELLIARFPRNAVEVVLSEDQVARRARQRSLARTWNTTELTKTWLTSDVHYMYQMCSTVLPLTETTDVKVVVDDDVKKVVSHLRIYRLLLAVTQNEL